MKFLVLLCAVAWAEAGMWADKCSNDPNSVREHLYYKSCNTGDVIQPQTITVTDGSGNVNYPINVAKPITITAKSQDNSNVVYHKLLVDVTLKSWSTLFGCRWITIPTFGLLNNLDGCSIGGNCPLNPGALTLKVAVDLSKYSAIITALASNTPYEIDIHIKNGDDSQHEEITCLLVEAMIAKSG